MMIVSQPGVVVSYPTAPLDAAMATRSEELRKAGRKLCWAKIVAAGLAACCFWAALWWVVGVLALSLFTSIHGCQLLSSRLAMTNFSSGCLGGPVNTLRSMYHLGIVNTVLSFLAVLSGVYATFLFEKTTRIFAICSCVFAAVLMILEAVCAYHVSKLFEICATDSAFDPIQMVPVGAAVPPPQQQGVYPVPRTQQQQAPVYGYPVAQPVQQNSSKSAA